MLLNVQSIRNKIDELYIFLDGIGFPDVLLLTEHWLVTDEPISVPEYNMLSKYSRSVSSHGGTLIMVRSSLLEAYSFVDFKNFDHMIVEREFEFSIMNVPVLNAFIVCLYRPPSADVPVFMSRLELLLAGFPLHAWLILAGDFNVNFADKTQIHSQLLSNLFVSFGLTMHVKEPTRVTKFSSTLIDYVCSSRVSEFVSCYVLNAGLSDHEAVLCNFNISKGKTKPIRQEGRLYTRRNYGRFSQLCSASNWGYVLSSPDPLEHFHALLSYNFNIAFPLKTVKRRIRKPWLTKGLRTSARNMRSLHMLRKHFLDNAVFMSYFTRYRQLYRRLIKIAKQKYYSSRIANSNNRQKESWKIVKELIGRNGTSTNSDLTSEQLNLFYCSVADNLSSNINPTVDALSFLGDLFMPDTFYFYPTDIREIRSVFTKMKNLNSSGWDDMSLRIFIMLPDRALQALAEAINNSFSAGTFPSFLKLARVIPLFKGGDSESASNFRPISLLPTMSKIVEKLVKSRVVGYINRHGFLNGDQFGFRESKGTNDAMFSLLRDLYVGLNDGDVAAAVFCDLTKAFDCVNHRVLLRKLEMYGFRGTSLDWMSSYLFDRRQCVRFNGQESEFRAITSGVPQGSVLGPLLFLLYINDLSTIDISGKFTMFADDTTILWHDRDVERLEDRVNVDILTIKEWFNANFLTLNISKTNIVSFKCQIGNVSLDTETLQRLQVSKFLGLHIDERLKFEYHVSQLCRKLSRGCFALRMVSRELDMSMARNVYFALIDSHLRYGVCFWGSCSDQLFNSVFVLQKRAIRFLCKLNIRESCRPYFLSLGILTLACIFILESVCLTHDKYHNEIVAAGAYATRSSHIAALPIPSTTFVKKSIIYNSKKLFNHLPLSARKIGNRGQFRRVVGKILVARAYYSVAEFFNETFV